MRAVVQRVQEAWVRVAAAEVARIGPGLLVLAGVAADDGPADVAYLAQKLAHLRVFAGDDRLLHLSLLDTGFELLLVSQFTILGDCRKGRRPSFDNAAPPELAEKLYEDLAAALSGLGRTGYTFALEHEDVKPDMVIIGKAIGGGIMPLSAIATRRDIMDVIK